MTKQQREEIDNLYNLSNNTAKKEKEEKEKAKEREKRIKQRKNEQKDQFDFDTETVIGMTNKNNNRRNLFCINFTNIQYNRYTSYRK